MTRGSEIRGNKAGNGKSPAGKAGRDVQPASQNTREAAGWEPRRSRAWWE